MNGVDAYPLCWPEGWPRTPAGRRQRSAFRVSSFARVRDGVMRELDLMGGRQIVLSSNVPLRLDGMPYANRREPDDPAVAVYWLDRKSNEQRCMACDRWDRVRDNLRAIQKSIEALRGLERWGSSDIVDRAFRGFGQLSPSGGDWRSILGFPPGQCPPIGEIKRRYRDLAVKAHPDHGGSDRAMQRLNDALVAAGRELA